MKLHMLQREQQKKGNSVANIRNTGLITFQGSSRTGTSSNKHIDSSAQSNGSEGPERPLCWWRQCRHWQRWRDRKVHKKYGATFQRMSLAKRRELTTPRLDVLCYLFQCCCSCWWRARRKEPSFWIRRFAFRDLGLFCLVDHVGPSKRSIDEILVSSDFSFPFKVGWCSNGTFAANAAGDSVTTATGTVLHHRLDDRTSILFDNISWVATIASFEYFIPRWQSLFLQLVRSGSSWKKNQPMRLLVLLRPIPMWCHCL